MKDGHKTTEFWIVVVIEVLAVLMKAFGVDMPPEVLAAIMSLPPTGYAIGRGLAKQGNGR